MKLSLRQYLRQKQILSKQWRRHPSLQKKLIELGYLYGDADGDFGGKTESAIKALQEAYGMEATGVATNEFQQQLFADDSGSEDDDVFEEVLDEYTDIKFIEAASAADEMPLDTAG